MKALDKIQFNENGLVPVITQDFSSSEILMMAWMNKEALSLTVKTKKAVYFSRSRKKLWFKGEESGHQQKVTSIRLDCDNDAILLQVVQKGGIACHTGRHHCFYQQLEDGRWQTTEPVLKDPKEIYK